MSFARDVVDAADRSRLALVAIAGDGERSEAIRAEGHHRVAHLWLKLGRRDEARKEYETARVQYEKRRNTRTGNPAARRGKGPKSRRK